jgi:hypothetical protein
MSTKMKHALDVGDSNTTCTVHEEASAVDGFAASIESSLHCQWRCAPNSELRGHLGVYPLTLSDNNADTGVTNAQ